MKKNIKLNSSTKIYVAGHNGMVGSSILRCLEKNGFSNVVGYRRSQFDLTDQSQAKEVIYQEKPDYIILAAAKVGGILVNSKHPGQFLYENIAIQNNVIHYAHKAKVAKLIFLGSACIYPKLTNQPMKEDQLLTGALEQTNQSYAIAKIAGIKMCESYFHEYGDNFISLMPNNLYGPNDNFDLQTSHVVPALMRKFHEAKILNKKHIQIWGSGKPMREFLHVDDLSEAVLFVLKNINAKDLKKNNVSHLNIGSGDELTIKNLAHTIKKIVSYEGDIVFDHSKPDGTPRKLLDSSLIQKIGWKAKISLEQGLKELYKWYLTKLPYKNI